jgi:hypothetical protein
MPRFKRTIYLVGMRFIVVGLKDRCRLHEQIMLKASLVFKNREMKRWAKKDLTLWSMEPTMLVKYEFWVTRTHLLASISVNTVNA